MSEAITATSGTRVVNGRQVPEAGTWEIDPSHQSFEFVARHLMAKVRGKFSGVSGAATVAEVPEDVDPGDRDRHHHRRHRGCHPRRPPALQRLLRRRGPPHDQLPQHGVRPDEGESHWKVDGDLTIKGTTRPVTVDLEFLGGAIDPWGNQRIGFSGVVPEVNREDWGLTWNAPLETGGFLLSKSVRLEIEAELVRK